MKFNIFGYPENPARKLRFDSNLARIMHTCIPMYVFDNIALNSS